MGKYRHCVAYAPIATTQTTAMSAEAETKPTVEEVTGSDSDSDDLPGTSLLGGGGAVRRGGWAPAADRAAHTHVA